MNILKTAKVCSTLGPIGFFIAPGTVASLLMLPCIWLMRDLSGSTYCLINILMAISAYFIIRHALPWFSESDPSCIVIDECIGSFITFITIPKTVPYLILGFFLFRFFDITKWYGIHMWQSLPGAWGILLDDIVAAVYANILLHMANLVCMIILR